VKEILERLLDRLVRAAQGSFPDTGRLGILLQPGIQDSQELLLEAGTLLRVVHLLLHMGLLRVLLHDLLHGLLHFLLHGFLHQVLEPQQLAPPYLLTLLHVVHLLLHMGLLHVLLHVLHHDFLHQVLEPQQLAPPYYQHRTSQLVSLPFQAVLSLKTVLPPSPSAPKVLRWVLRTLEHRERSGVEAGSFPLVEGGNLQLVEDRHPDSQTVEEGREEGRADGDPEEGRERMAELHMD